MIVRAVTAVTLLSLLAGCSDDSPVTHEPVHYNVYATASDYLNNETVSHLYWYDADSLTLIDSLLLPNIALWGEASPDGRYLYLSMWSYRIPHAVDYLVKWEIASKTEIWRHTAVGAAKYSPLRMIDNGELLIYGTELIDAETGETVRTLTEDPFPDWILQFGPSSSREIAAIRDEVVGRITLDSLVTAIDVTTGEMRGEFVARLSEEQPPLAITHARLHPDHRRVVCVGAIGSDQNAWVVVGDLETGKQLMASQISTEYAEVAISDDGARAVVVDHANSFFGYGWPAVYIYDLNTYQRLAMLDSRSGLYYWPGQVRFLPGDRRAVIVPEPGITGVGWIQTIDLNSLSLEYVVDTPFTEPQIGAFAVGPRTEQ